MSTKMIDVEGQPSEPPEYDDRRYVKRNVVASRILLLKMISTFPFNLVGIYKPENLRDYDWILYIEAFHHYHARIFYLLALHRNLTQLYCCMWGDGLMQHRLILLEALFDMGLVVLYIDEFYMRKNNAFMTTYTAIHGFICMLSLYSLKLTSKIKVKAIA